MSLSDYQLTLQQQVYAPLVVGGMGVDISTADLALAIARLGGIGHISDAMAPWVSDRRYRTHFQSEKEKRFREFRDRLDKPGVKWEATETYQASLRHTQVTMERKQGSGGVFINVMEKLSMGDARETLRARLRGALDGGIDGITLSAGLHLGSLELIADHPRFKEVNLGIIVSSTRALKIFLRSAKRAGRLPDYCIVEGPLAGGHLGFGLDWGQFDLKAITAEVISFLREEELDIAVIPAGGIFTGTDATDLLKGGAAAVQVATRFTITQECGLPQTVKEIYLRATEDDIVVNLVSPTGYAMRMLRSSPCLASNVRPQCEALGYMLDREGHCAYHDAYQSTPTDSSGEKLPVREKMCICYHFMRFNCYTCGHFVYRLKDTTTRFVDGKYYLPIAEQVFSDYMTSENHEINRASPITQF